MLGFGNHFRSQFSRMPHQSWKTAIESFTRIVRERAFDYVVTVTAPLSGGYVHTQIMIMMQNYDVSNHYSEIES